MLPVALSVMRCPSTTQKLVRLHKGKTCIAQQGIEENRWIYRSQLLQQKMTVPGSFDRWWVLPLDQGSEVAMPEVV